MIQHSVLRKTFGVPCAAAALAATLLLGACQMPSNSAGAQSSSSGTTGSLSISIPVLAPWLANLQSSSKSKGLSPRAIALTTEATITVTKSDGTTNVIDPVTSSASGYMGTSGTSGTSVSLSVPYVPAGSGYIVTLSLYNTNTSSTTPTVVGKATGVTITAGATTSVTVLCTPTNPTALTIPASASASLPPNGEQWYSFNGIAGTTYYIYNANVQVNMPMGIFDSLGNYQTSANSYLTYTPTSGGTVYVAVVNATTPVTTQTSSLVVQTTPVARGTTSSPASIGTVPSGSVLSYYFLIEPDPQSTSYYTFKTSDAGDYYFDTSSNSSSEYTGKLYVDSSFSTNLESVSPCPTMDGSPTYTGGLLKNLAANTTYYLSLASFDSGFTIDYISNFQGCLMTPAAVSAATKYNDGSYNSKNSPSATPVALSLGANAGKVGYHSYDMESYYSFTPASSGNYTISAVATASDASIFFEVYLDSAFSSYIGEATSYSNPTGTVSLSSGTTYYIGMWNLGGNKLTNYNYTLTITKN